MTELAGWANFFVIVGSSAGALIGLQFVVITLVADAPRTPGLEQAGGAYATPTIVHFGTVLLLSAVLSAPWHGIGGASLVWFLVGFAGVAYSIIVARRLRAHAGYQPVFEDWLFHALLPLVAYVLLAASAYAARAHSHPGHVCRRAGGTAIAFQRHPQRMGRRYLPCLRSEARTSRR